MLMAHNSRFLACWLKRCFFFYKGLYPTKFICRSVKNYLICVFAGFVPKAHFSSYHSKTFPDICNAALKDFTEDQVQHHQYIDNLRDTMKMQESGNLISPQRQVSNKAYSGMDLQGAGFFTLYKFHKKIGQFLASVFEESVSANLVRFGQT